MSNALKSSRKSARNGVTTTTTTRRPRLKQPRRPRLALAAPATAAARTTAAAAAIAPASTPDDRRQRARTAPGFASRRGQALVNGMTKAEIVEKYTAMVRITALKLARNLPGCVDKDDLISTGYIGLMDAADKYDSDRGVKFETYAEFRVKGAMLDELRKQDWVPRSVRSQVKAVEKASHAVQGRTGRQPTDREVSRKLGMSLENYFEMKKEIGALTLLNFEQAGAFQGPDAPSLDETIENASTPDPLHELTRKDAQALLERLSQHLSDQERTVVSCYYFRGLNLKEISTILDLTESRICQLHTQAIRKLKTQLSVESASPKHLFLMLLNEP